MGKWYGKNKGNKQKRSIKLWNRTEKISNLEFAQQLPIIFYCKICRFETNNESNFKNHLC